MANPKRGEVWLADLGIAAKVRPVLVVSVEYSDGDYALISVVPHTTSPRGAAFEVAVPVPRLKAGAFNVQGLLAVPPRVFLRKIVDLQADQMELIDAGLRQWLGL